MHGNIEKVKKKSYLMRRRGLILVLKGIGSVPIVVVFLVAIIGFIAGSCRKTHNVDASGSTSEMRLVKIGEIGANEEKAGVVLFNPNTLMIDKEGNIYVLNSYSVSKFSRGGMFLREFGQRGKGPGELSSPCSFYVDASQNVFVLDNASALVSEFTNDGTFVKSFRTVVFPEDIVVDSHGSVFVSSTSLANMDMNRKHRMTHIFKYDSSGEFMCTFGDKKINSFDPVEDMINKGYMTIDESDHVFYCFKYRNEIREYADDGRFVRAFSNDLGYEVPLPKGNVRRSSSGQQVDISLFTPWICRGISCGQGQNVWTIVPTGPRDSFKRGALLFVDVFDSVGEPIDRIPLREAGFSLCFAVNVKAQMFALLRYSPLPIVSFYKILRK